jgi:hypothetical protein
MKWTHTVRELNKYKDYVLKQSKSGLTRAGIKSSSKLYKSLRGIVAVKQNRTLTGKFASGNHPELTFEMNDYGKFVDKGVQGTKESATGKKYKFDKSKDMINIGAVESFIGRKVRVRSNDGKFKAFTKKSKKSLIFAIAKSIHQKGIKRSLFFTKPLERRAKKTYDNIGKAAADDITLQFVYKIKQLIN